MGERKGVNKYYPPDYDPERGGLNKFLGSHALRERARKLHMGILIIRFEMPYNIWCDGCENHIGTGVRYNAEKKKVGMYYSTPIYQFRMKCHLCDNHFEIKTDPANLDYVIVSGARRQERRWDPNENEQIAPEDKDVTRKLATDAMFKLEHGVQDKTKKIEAEPTLKLLEGFQASRWKDDYDANRCLRAKMRVKRQEAVTQKAIDDSYNINVSLLPPNQQDVQDAKLIHFNKSKFTEIAFEERKSCIDTENVFSKLKVKKVPPSVKKEVAKQALKTFVKNGSNISSKNSNVNLSNAVVMKSKRNSETDDLFSTQKCQSVFQNTNFHTSGINFGNERKLQCSSSYKCDDSITSIICPSNSNGADNNSSLSQMSINLSNIACSGTANHNSASALQSISMYGSSCSESD